MTSRSLDYDPISPRWRENPYPMYRRLRDEAPVRYAESSRTWCVSRYEDVQHVLKSPEIFSSRAMFTFLMMNGDESPKLGWGAIPFLARFTLAARTNPFTFQKARNLIAEDGGVHAALRGIVNRGFTPRRIASWEPRVRELAQACTEKLRRGERFDLVHDLAIPLPVTIIAEMLGVEPERRADFKRWSDTVIWQATGEGRGDRFHARTVRDVCELYAYLRRMIAARRRSPSDDLISTLLAEQDGANALTSFEISQFVMLLLVAGNETTTNLIGNAVCALLDHPAELARVGADPLLLPGAVEEALRYDSPIQLLFRTATQDTEIGGVRIPAGAWVVPMLGSANRDERRFEDPDRFDVTRNPQGHVAFGFGQHFCLGASLARLEARTALEVLLPELAGLRRASPQVEHIDSFLVRGPSRLELARAA
ncbi:MAG TPA: cytochrome P450 [Myxococcota bacterium]|nr:cytochrome P450 [Myxococcota bacterium]